MNKKKIKISQIQIQGFKNPYQNAILLKKQLIKTNTFNPDLISTPECSNIITNDQKYLLKYSTFQSECPILYECKKFAKKYNKIIHIGSLLLKKKKSSKLINRSFIIGGDGKIKKFYDKINLFDANISKGEKYNESDYFEKGQKLSIVRLMNIKIGMLICYDLRFPNLFRSLSKKGVKIIFVPAAFTVATGKAHWETLIRARAIENRVFILATGQCGFHHSGRKTYGHSMAVGPWGVVINKAGSIPKILNSIINLSDIEISRSKIPSIHF